MWRHVISKCGVRLTVSLASRYKQMWRTVDSVASRYRQVWRTVDSKFGVLLSASVRTVESNCGVTLSANVAYG